MAWYRGISALGLIYMPHFYRLENARWSVGHWVVPTLELDVEAGHLHKSVLWTDGTVLQGEMKPSKKITLCQESNMVPCCFGVALPL